MKVLLPVFYLPPVSWFAVFLQNDAEITLEIFENFPKQTYRNRTVILGANGRLPLIIPICHNGRRPLNELAVSQRENWQEQHWKSIKNAYRRSPYFEFYEDRLQEIFTVETNSLLDFNLKALEVIRKILKSEKTFALTSHYIKNPEQVDYRSKFSTKHDIEVEMEAYYQTFTDKFGFQKDLSIVDLICNKGPESLTYIKNIQTK
ncbi:WbqC family protein [Kaistella palustris]|uniref:WbqC family protein n=1 Tax=Kaistella palustris TaxID=493376 RepID=UPI0003FC1EFE|nr:WbqC family protein [Kaistella palustris]